MAAQADLVALRDGLIKARLAGVREFRDSNGETVRYGSDREMAAAIASADRMIADAGRRHSSTIRFSTSKGL